MTQASWPPRHDISAAGIESPLRQRWTCNRIIEAIQDWYPGGHPQASVWSHNRNLTAAATRYFGTWHQALRAAGIEPKCRLWTAERVLTALRAWQQNDPQTGLWIADKGLAVAAKKYFGSHEKALLAAGAEPKPRKWSKPILIKAIQKRTGPAAAGGSSGLRSRPDHAGRP